MGEVDYVFSIEKIFLKYTKLEIILDYCADKTKSFFGIYQFHNPTMHQSHIPQCSIL